MKVETFARQLIPSCCFDMRTSIKRRLYLTDVCTQHTDIDSTILFMYKTFEEILLQVVRQEGIIHHDDK